MTTFVLFHQLLNDAFETIEAARSKMHRQVFLHLLRHDNAQT